MSVRNELCPARSRAPLPAPPALAVLLALAAAPSLGAGTLVISEFRLGGPGGSGDEFVEIYNASGVSHTVTAFSGNGYAVAASDGLVRCTIPNGTVVPASGRFLCTGIGYSLANYGGTGATAGNASLALEIADNAGIALFDNDTGGASFSLARRFDAVGSSAEGNSLYREGTGYPALASTASNHAFVRDECGKKGVSAAVGPCPASTPRDTGDNAADFYFVDTAGTVTAAGQRLGAPGPQRLQSPLTGGQFGYELLDRNADPFAYPNYVRDLTSDPSQSSTFGTVVLRRRFVNYTGTNVTRLRFRVVDLNTLTPTAGFADLRPRSMFSSGGIIVNDIATCAATGSPSTPPCTVNATGVTLEEPPTQTLEGGFNSSLSVGTVTSGTPIAPGASINVQFLFGVEQIGKYRLTLILEGTPQGGWPLFVQCGLEVAHPCSLFVDGFDAGGMAPWSTPVF